MIYNLNFIANYSDHRSYDTASELQTPKSEEFFGKISAKASVSGSYIFDEINLMKSIMRRIIWSFLVLVK